MKTSFIVATILAATANFGAASPIAEGNALNERNIETRAADDVGFGQQISEYLSRAISRALSSPWQRLTKFFLSPNLEKDTQQNMWVVWQHGENACPNQRYLNSLVQSPCGIKFRLTGQNEELQLCDCDSNNEPQSPCDSGGNKLKSCKSKDHKMGCPDGQHDIVQHGHCS